MSKKLLIVIIGIFILHGCGESQESDSTKKVDPVVKVKKAESAVRYRELANLYVGKTVPYSQYSEIGTPETLKGTTNQQWVAYFPKGDFTIVTNKQTDIVRTIYIGKREF